MPVSNQPRYLKRIHLLTKLGYSITAYYFERNEPVPQLSSENIRFVKIGSLEHGKYLRRLLPMLKLARRLRKDTSPAYLIFSVDLLLAAILAGKTRIIYEIGDMREVNSSLFRRLYAYLLKKCTRIIVTSDRFATHLSETYGTDPSKIVFHPHLLEEHQFDPDLRVYGKSLLSKNVVHIGFAGLLRYDSVSQLLDGCRNHSQIRIHIRGRGDYEKEVAEKVVPGKDTFSGAFQYPEDLRDIYAAMDINFVMYDSSDANVTMLLPNKLYETIYFATPLIVSFGTHLANIVEKYGIGLVWDYSRIDTLGDYLSSSEFRDLYPDLVQNLIKIPDDDILRKKDELSELFSNLDAQR